MLDALRRIYRWIWPDGFIGGDTPSENFHSGVTKSVTPLRLVTHRSINIPHLYTDSRGDRWSIYPSAPPSFMWSYVHDDFDGAPDGNDDRFGHADTLDDCIDEIEERIPADLRRAHAALPDSLQPPVPK